MTHDFVHNSPYCRFSRLLSENVIKKGGWVTVVVFKLSDFQKVNFASFLTRRHSAISFKFHPALSLLAFCEHTI